NAPKGRGRPEGGARAAARALGFDRAVVSRAVKIASISKVARAAIKEANLDDHQAKLLKIASQPAAQQLAKVAELTRRESRSQKQHRQPAAAMPEKTNDASAAGAPHPDQTREIALAHLLAERLGPATGRFLSLISEIGSDDLGRLAAAVQQRIEIVAE